MERTILIVDDSPYIVDGLAALLKRKGYGTIACNGGEEALATLGTVQPDLILLDIMMEPIDGWETLGKIKAGSTTRDIPVLMFSSKKISLEEAEEHGMGIGDFVSKPVNPSQLLDAISRIFERSTSVRTEALQARDKGVDKGPIEEYSALRKGIEADKNLLVGLKKSSGTHIFGKVIPSDEPAAIGRLEAKILAAEQRLRDTAYDSPHDYDPDI